MGTVVALVPFLGTARAQKSEARPNILWITSEDNGISWVGCYGGRNARTPNIDQLAADGFRYTHCFDNAAVCAPTRSTWITGHYAISLGTQPMRSRYAIPHDKIPYYPDLLKAAGYQAFNGGKTDYNIGSRDDKDCWLVDGKVPKRQADKKFFQNLKMSSRGGFMVRPLSVLTIHVFSKSEPHYRRVSLPCLTLFQRRTHRSPLTYLQSLEECHYLRYPENCHYLFRHHRLLHRP